MWRTRVRTVAQESASLQAFVPWRSSCNSLILRNGEVTWRSELLQRLQEVRGNCKTRNQLAGNAVPPDSYGRERDWGIAHAGGPGRHRQCRDGRSGPRRRAPYRHPPHPGKDLARPAREGGLKPREVVYEICTSPMHVARTPTEDGTAR